ncbi:hypothetical protein [Clostridium thailandense]|uniref:hypothetical protein n=1 Tax=Clostridium thailandense TaxID=2794346 RepID=UPI003988DBF8
MENQVMSIFVQAVLSILGVLVSYLTTVAVSYLNQKKEALIKQMGAEQYNATYNIAKGIYFAVEQQFKLSSQSGKQKAEEFNKLLLSKIPGLTQEEIDHFREAIVGEINSQLNKTNLIDPAK